MHNARHEHPRRAEIEHFLDTLKNTRHEALLRRNTAALLELYAIHGRLEWVLLPNELKGWVRASKRRWDENDLGPERRRYWELMGVDLLESYRKGAVRSQLFITVTNAAARQKYEEDNT